MTNSVKSNVWTSVCCMALLIGGCPKRQSVPRLVYVTPPPATAAEPAPDSGTLVIEEPAPPEPEAKPAEEPPPPAPPPKPQTPKPRKSGTSAEAAVTEPTPEESSSVDVRLEPANTPEQAGLRQKKTETELQDMRQRVNESERSPVSAAELRTLEEARAFLNQSERALKDGDLQRAEKLAQKASLLITAFEKRH